MKKLFLVVLAIVMLAGCPSPQPPQPPDPTVTTTVQDTQSKLLEGAINTGCTLSKAFLVVNGNYPLIQPYIPPSIAGQVAPAINAFHSVLNLYNKSVLTWAEKDTEQPDFTQLLQDVTDAKNKLMPLIQQIIDAMNKKKQEEKVKTELEVVVMKGVFTCGIEDLKNYESTVRGVAFLPVQ